MQRFLGILVVLSFAGCASRTPGRVIGGSMVALGGFSLLAAETSSETDQSFDEAFRQDMNKTGGLIMLVAGAVVLVFNEARPLHESPPPAVSTERIAGAETVQSPATDDAQLRQLTLQASFAARRGQCNAVRVIADKVGELDATYRRGGFVADASIVACL